MVVRHQLKLYLVSLLFHLSPSLLFMLKKIRSISLESLSKITILSIKLVQEPTVLFHYTLTCTRTTKRQTMIYNTLHSKLEIEQSEPL
jgi:hypothetical protein